MARGDKGFGRKKEASSKAADSDTKAKQDLQKKMSKPGGAGRLSRAELRLARRMDLGEGQD